MPWPLLFPDPGRGADPPISLAKRASLRRFNAVSRTRRSMSCVVTGAPFSMLAELPMTMASSRATRRALASSISVAPQGLEGVAAILPAAHEDGTTFRRQEQTANDQPQVAGIDLR